MEQKSAKNIDNLKKITSLINKKKLNISFLFSEFVSFF